MDLLFGGGPAPEAVDTAPRPRKRSRRAAGRGRTATKDKAETRGFAGELDAMLQEALNDPSNYLDDTPEKSRRGSDRGLDAIIRDTVESSEVQIQKTKPKRVTFSFDPDKLEALRKIAKNKKAYLREVVDEIVTDYLKRRQ